MTLSSCWNLVTPKLNSESLVREFDMETCMSCQSSAIHESCGVREQKMNVWIEMNTCRQWRERNPLYSEFDDFPLLPWGSAGFQPLVLWRTLSWCVWWRILLLPLPFVCKNVRLKMESDDGSSPHSANSGNPKIKTTMLPVPPTELLSANLQMSRKHYPWDAPISCLWKCMLSYRVGWITSLHFLNNPVHPIFWDGNFSITWGSFFHFITLLWC